MAKLSHTDSRRMYSWWWDSHISPKNSKWLQENLTDMDVKVKSMIKLIEEDADSFARRAEMYYKKRPELMKMVEEFYRAYRALAERYDHATGVIRHAHRTMSEAFPNQLPMMFGDDSPASFASGTDPRTPDMSNPGELNDDSDSVTRRKAWSDERVRRGLNFDEAEEKDENNHHAKDIKLSKHNEVSDSMEIQSLKDAIAKLEAEKEAGLVQYQQSLDKLSQLEDEISKTREDLRVLNDHAKEAENEAVVLKEALTKLETEKESNFQDYQKCLEKISNLQSVISTTEEDSQKLNERAIAAETEAQSLKSELGKLTTEKDAALNQYMQSLEMISILENKLQLSEEDARRLKERAEKAESEVEALKQIIAKLTEDKEAAALQYQQSLETISSLEHELAVANEEIGNGVSKLKGAEEKCLLLEKSNQSLNSELESLMLKMGTQSQELTEKQKELGRLWASVQEERLRFLEAETAFQTLQHLHAQTQEELRAMASELHNRAQALKVVETQNQSLQDEVLKVRQENKHLDEVNASSALSMRDMENEITILKESKGKLQEEVKLRLDQRNALQQEIYCLREELNDLNKKHFSILEQVHAVNLVPESLGSSVKALQDENENLKETCKKETIEKAALLGKLEILGQLLEKNSLLETSIADLHAELEAVREKIEALEQSCQILSKDKSALLDENASLMTQLQETNKNLEQLTANNTVVVNSLSEAHHQIEGLKAKSKILEDSCQLLVNEKAGLISEKDGLSSQLENTQIRLDDLEKIHGELEGRCMTLEKEKETTLRKVEELRMSLEVERQKHGNYVQMSETHLTGVESEMRLLQQEYQGRKRELDRVLDDAVDNEIEIFVLRVTAQQLKESNHELCVKNKKLIEESSLCEKKILQLEQNNSEQQVEIKSLSHQVTNLREGTCQLLETLGVVEDHACKDGTEQDQVIASKLLSKLQNMKGSLYQAEEENMRGTLEFLVLVTWIRQLRQDSQNLELEKNKIEHELNVRTEQVLVLKNEALVLLQMNEELRSKLKEGDCNQEALLNQIEDLNRKLMDLQNTCQVLEKEKNEISEEKRSLSDNFLQLKGKKNDLEEENNVLCGEVFSLENLSLILKSCAAEKLIVSRELGDDLYKLHDMNAALAEKLSVAEGRLEESKTENLHLMERLQKSDNELKVVSTMKDQLSSEFEKGKKLLHQMTLELQEAEQKICLREREKLELNGIVEGLRAEYNEVKMVRDQQENQLLKLSADNDRLSRENKCVHEASEKLEVELHELQSELNKRNIQEESLHIDMQKKTNEIVELEAKAASIFGELQFYMATQLLYEQKYHELQEACLGYIDQNEGLTAELVACGPEIMSFKECISSLEDHADIHIKFQNPENEESQGAQVTNKSLTTNTLSDLRDQRVRLQAIAKAAVEIKEQMVQENTDLHTKLEASMKQIELLQSERGRYRRNLRATSEITEADGALLTKDIVLDQASDGSSYGFSKRQVDNQNFESWETSDPDGTLALKVSKSKKIVSSPDFPRAKSIRKQKSGFSSSERMIEKELSMDKLEISKGSTEPFQEGNKRKVLERLDSDVQKLANLQITIQDLKRKLEVTEKGKRGKAVIECEALKGQLDEADVAIMKLFDLNGRLMRNIEDNNSSFSDPKSSFDLEGDGNTSKRRVSEQARRMSEKIGRLQLEVQKLQFVLLKLDDQEAKNKMSDARRRVILKDYLYGVGRTGQRRKKAQFCGCVQPSTVED